MGALIHTTNIVAYSPKSKPHHQHHSHHTFKAHGYYRYGSNAPWCHGYQFDSQGMIVYKYELKTQPRNRNAHMTNIWTANRPTILATWRVNFLERSRNSMHNGQSFSKNLVLMACVAELYIPCGWWCCPSPPPHPFPATAAAGTMAVYFALRSLSFF